MSYHSNADLGGQAVSGAVILEPEGELFHAPWEARVLALTLAMGSIGLWNIDMSRAARETLADYRKLSYYEIWLKGLEKLLLNSGALLASVRPSRPALRADGVAAALARGSNFSRPATRPARFRIGQQVRTDAAQATHHTRLPGYARGKVGVVERIHGVHVFPDSNAGGAGESPQWLYGVAFTEKELWGDALAAQRSVISVDAFEPYLQPA
jgi:nitrile hydratase beta subunit